MSEPSAENGDAGAASDAPPASVLEELQAAFGAGGSSAPPPAEAPAPPPPPPPAAGVPQPPEEERPHSEPGQTSLTIIADSLVPEEATKRSQRRSRREAKREAKRQARRAAAAEKEAKRAATKARRAAKRSGKSSPRVDVDVVEEGASAEESAVRIIAGSTDTAPPASAPDSPSAVPRATVAIDDDGLPDPVYVAGELGDGDGGDQRSTVFIDDRGPGTGELVTIDVATSAARMEPRMRERRIAVKRAVGRKRLKWVAIGVTAVGVVVAVFGVLGSGLFAISSVEVEGAVYSQGELLDAVVDELDGTNVLRVDTAAAERQLEKIAWVDDARVTTDFPNGATIEIRERRPMVACLAADGQYRVLDTDGRVLDVIAGRPVDYLELMVDDGPELAAGALAPSGYRAAATLVSALTPQMRQRATSMLVDSNATELSLMLDDQIEVRFGAAEDLLDKLVRLQTALTNPNPDLTATELIDVSTEDVIVR